MANISNNNSSLNLMKKRLGVLWPQTDEEFEAEIKAGRSTASGVNLLSNNLESNGGHIQQNRMIFDKLRSLDRAVRYSYQGAHIMHVESEVPGCENERPILALINPNKLKQDYDDKILSVRYDFDFKPGDVFHWLETNTYWLIYLQDLDELAYFRGDIRRCSYEISWEDEDGLHTTFAAVRGPVETKINFIQKHQISVDEPNHSLSILMPRTEAALKYFRRYSKFYLNGQDKGSPQVCWRVEATDWISTPGILEVVAVEYYSNEQVDDVDNGIAGGLTVIPTNPNTVEVEKAIEGETFITPRMTYTYTYTGDEEGEWTFDKKDYPIHKEIDGNTITIRWNSSYSGNFKLSYAGVTKEIVVASLF